MANNASVENGSLLDGRAELPIVFGGLSMSVEDAAAILLADYRPPIRRGDLEKLTGREVVVILDGVFDQTLAVSPGEIRAALAKGVTIFGASSMGALRAAEVPGVVGIGRIYELYARGELENDDEVALIFDPRDCTPLSDPLVNIRHAAQRLASTGTISRETAAGIIEAAASLPYPERAYDTVLDRAGLGDATQRAQLSRMLSAIDLKREDAHTALEHVRRWLATAKRGVPAAATPRADCGSRPQASAGKMVHLWEFGPPVPFREVVHFMALTASLPAWAERAAACLTGPDTTLEVDEAVRDRLLDSAARDWGWATAEEVGVSLRDLGLSAERLDVVVGGLAALRGRAQGLLRAETGEMLAALRHLLFLEDLTLKRESARAICLRSVAERGARDGPVTESEIKEARLAFARWHGCRDAVDAEAEAASWGVPTETVANLLTQLALAKRVTFGPLRAGDGIASASHPWLESCPKAGDARFCVRLEDALAVAERLRPVVGITRLAIITGLGTVGIPNAQAFRPDGEWSSTVGSGKSETEAGARIGAVMEEVEKWSQERFADDHSANCVATASYHALVREGQEAINPTLFDLPYDSSYDPDLAIDWYRCADLVSGRDVLVPAAAFTHRRLAVDIYYSPQGARKTVTTNGLAAGLTIAEALTHALCEYIERHARTMRAVIEENPGRPQLAAAPLLDLATAPAAVRRLVERIERADYRLVARDIRVDIDIPVLAATILIPDGLLPGRLYGDGWRRASGWASHPDPETALKMAVLEASQTLMSHVAGAREDLTLQARSLGRHERSDARRAAAFANELNSDLAVLSFDRIQGFQSDDAGTDMRWLLARLCDAGCERVLAMDYSRPEAAPARVVRVVVPGLETINAFHTGLRARRALVEDLLGPGLPLSRS